MINPTAVLLSGVMLLRHLHEFDAADRVEHALLVTVEHGAYTRDVRPDGCVTTSAFTERVIANLGRRSAQWKVRAHRAVKLRAYDSDPVFVRPEARHVVGVDVFLESGRRAPELGKNLEDLCAATPLRLKMISNRGTRVYRTPAR